MPKTAFIGLGAMGARMASNLIKAGHRVTVFDPAPEAVKKLAASGAHTAKSARAAAEGNDFVIAMVRDDDTSRKVWLDATEGALLGMHPGAVAIECSTISPVWARELGEHLIKASLGMLDAPVSGSTPQAQDARLVFLVGGEAETLKRSEIVLKSMGSTVRHAGPVGAGALAKLVTNTLMGVQLSTIAEMIGMLQKHGVDAQLVLDAVKATPLWSPHLSDDVSHMLAGDFETRFPIKLLLKDLNYTIDAAGGATSAPTVSKVHDVFQKAADEKLGDLDMTAVVKLFEHRG